MNKYTWQFLTISLCAASLGTAYAGTIDQKAPTETQGTYNEATPQATDGTVAPSDTKKKKKHRRAEGTNRSSRPGTTTGEHSVGGNDTPAQMGVPQTDTTKPAATTY